MGTIAWLLGNIKLSINRNDHGPPHLHVECPEGRFRVFFHDYSVQTILGNPTKARKDLAEVIHWMESHQEALQDRWTAKERLEEIRRID